MNPPTKEEWSIVALHAQVSGCRECSAAAPVLRALAEGRLVVCTQNWMHEGFPIYGPAISIPGIGG